MRKHRLLVLLLSLASACDNTGANGNPDGAKAGPDGAGTSTDTHLACEDDTTPLPACLEAHPLAGGAILCGDVVRLGTCVNGQPRCPDNMLPSKSCTCLGPPRSDCTCTATGWSCPKPDGSADGDAGDAIVEAGVDRPDDVGSMETSADRPDDVDSQSCPNDVYCVAGGADSSGVVKCPGDVAHLGICENGKRRCPAGTVEPHTCKCIGPPGPDGGLFCPGDAGAAG